MKDITLLIMAAGMGSRFGGLKQIEPVGPNGEFIIDYSVYDAIRAGFTKVVFVIKEENYEIFKETIGSRIEDKIKVEYVFQKGDDLPEGYSFPERVKPWGTGHAILAARDAINEAFGVINADDFYGRESFEILSDFLRSKNEENELEYALIGYRTKNTLSENGSVKRGVCKQEGDHLTEIIESSIIRSDDKIVATPLDGSQEIFVEENALVSMNMWGFTSSFFRILNEEFEMFLKNNNNNYESCEFLIPEVVMKKIQDESIVVKVKDTKAVWYGITYKEDKSYIVEAINKYIEQGIYNKNLW